MQVSTGRCYMNVPLTMKQLAASSSYLRRRAAQCTITSNT